MKWFWINGWAIPLSHLEQKVRDLWPNVDHEFSQPTQTTALRLEEEEANRYIGYSLGAHLLLQSKKQMKKTQKVYLLAPFEFYPAEANCGGRIRLVQLKLQMRRLKTSPLQSISDFYKHAGLQLRSPQELPYPLKDLIWGLEKLMQTGDASERSYSCRSLVGAEDSLLNSKAIFKHFNNEGRSMIIENVGHALHPLLEKMKEEWDEF